MEWMLMPLRRYADFQGRSRRKEYWLFVLLNVIVFTVIPLLNFAVGGGGMFARMAQSSSNPFAVYRAMFGGFGLLLALWFLVILVPSVAVSVRRLHDRNLSGWWYLGGLIGGFIPFVGLLASIAMLVVFCLEGTCGPNRFGQDPKGPPHQDVFA